MKFEYKVLAVTSDEAVLNELGADRWELIVCVTRPGGYELIFKRQVK